MEMKFSLLIPTLNRPVAIKETLLSVLKQDLQPSIIYVIDQSDDDKTKNVCSAFPSVTYVRSSVKSLTAARNVGVRASVDAGMDFWVFIDDDVELDEGFFSIMRDTFAKNGSVVGVAPFVRTEPPIKWGRAANAFRLACGFDYYSKQVKFRKNFLATSLRYPPKEQRRVAWMSGCAMGVRNLHEKNIFLDENLILYSLAEDRDYSYRLSRLGDIIAVPNLKLFHKVTPEGRMPSRNKTFMVAVHGYYLLKKNFGRSPLGALMFWWNMAARFAVSLLTSLLGRVKGNKEMARSGKDVRDSIAYLARHKKEIACGNLNAFHALLLGKG